VRPLDVVAAGALTSVGLSAAETAFAVRAAAAGMREAPLVDPEGKPITMCFLPTFDPLLVGGRRALVLAAAALADCARNLGPAAKSLRARAALLLDEGADRNLTAQWAAWIDAELTAAARPHFAEIEIDVYPEGAASLGRIVPKLEAELDSGAIDVALVGGAHTDYDPWIIAELARAGRLFSPDNLDALIPGEAAAFVALLRPDRATRFSLTSRARILEIASATSRARADNDAPAFTAKGLTSAMRTALAPLGQTNRVGWVLTDLTFETFRHFEFQAASTRLAEHFCEPQWVESPAQRLGHLGAAAMPLHLALASEARRSGFTPHPYGLSIVGSESGRRAALAFSVDV